MTLDYGRNQARPRSFAAYAEHMKYVNSAFGPSAHIAPRLRGANQDVLVAKRPQVSFAMPDVRLSCLIKMSLYKQSRKQSQTGLEGALRHAKQANASKKPALPSLDSFNKLSVKDKKASEDIDDLTRKRRKVSYRLSRPVGKS